MQIKQLVTATTLLALTTIPAQALKPGPYIGGQLGVSRMQSKGEYIATPMVVTYNEKKTTNKGLAADFIAGYLMPAKQFLIGAEATVGIDLTKAKKYVISNTGRSDDTLTLKRKATSSFTAVIGKQVHEKVSLYAKAGVGFSRFKTQLTDDHRPKKSTTNTSLIAAVGAQTSLTKKESLRTEASYEQFKNVKASSIRTSPLGTVSLSARHKGVSVVGLKAGAVYHI